MPIYDLSYRHWPGVPGPRSQRWVPITWAGLLPLLKKRAFLFWMFLCWSPALVAGVFIYLRVSALQGDLGLNAGGLLEANAFFFREFAKWQLFLYMLTSAFAGAGLIANDRRTNALQIYLSKPLRPVDYLFGKALTVAAALGLVTLAPSLTLYVLRAGLDRQGGYVTSHLLLPFQIVAASALVIVTMSIISLAVSSLATSGRTAGVSLVMLYVFSESIRGILGLLFDRSYISLLSPVSNLKQGLDWVFGQNPSFDIHPAVSLVALAVFLAVCAGIVHRRIRPVEVVS